MLHACMCTGLVWFLTSYQYQYYFNAVRTVRWCKYPVLPLTKSPPSKGGKSRRGHEPRCAEAPLR